MNFYNIKSHSISTKPTTSDTSSINNDTSSNENNLNNNIITGSERTSSLSSFPISKEEKNRDEKINKIGRFYTPEKIEFLLHNFNKVVKCSQCQNWFQTKDAIGKWECRFHPGHITGNKPRGCREGTEKYTCCNQLIYTHPVGCQKCDHTDASLNKHPPQYIKIPWFFFKIDDLINNKDLAIIDMPQASRLKINRSIYDKDLDTMIFIVKHWEDENKN